MRKIALLTLTAMLLVPAAAFAQDSLPALFKQMKDEFAKGSYEQSLADLERLDALSAKPGNEGDRAKLVPVISFYRGVNLAALGRDAEAQQAFTAYLGFVPNAALDATKYPKRVVDSFNAARTAKSSGTSGSNLARAYESFRASAGTSVQADAKWALSPVRYLLTNEEKKRWAALTTDTDRAAFVEDFWKRLDPTPDTPANEFRTEMERRILFSATVFGAEDVAGRNTDRAVIFTFLGAPTGAGYAAIASTSDGRAVDAAGGEGNFMNTGRQAGAGLLTTTDATKGSRETWRYQKKQIPAGLRQTEINFHFITSPEGKAKMQRDPEPLQVLAYAVEQVTKNKSLP